MKSLKFYELEKQPVSATIMLDQPYNTINNRSLAAQNFLIHQM